MTSSPSDRRTGLRERKKAKTRAAIQEHALRLFIEQGYDETTTEQIAASAEISPSTFFRYFPTKQETVLYDPVDPVVVDGFLGQPSDLSPTSALRATIRAVLTELSSEQSELERARQELVFTVPELRLRMLEGFASTISVLADAAARRTGRDARDPQVLAWSGAAVGTMMAAMFEITAPQDFAGFDMRGSEFADRVDAGLACLEAGLPL